MKSKVQFNPILMFIILIVITILLSGILAFFNVQADYSTVNTVTNELSNNNVIQVENLLSGSGIKEGDELDFEEEDEDDAPVMKVLAQDGSTQMDLWGGERIFSRKNTKILIKKAKKADESKEDRDYKALGRYMFKCIKGQDERPPEYVERKE